ncbi:MAG: fibronectin type III domain-containing protein [Bacteroidales bacterium]|jgi:chitodextrinase|nr:fibronectin type III domain-containing protein [Bacteroidales bacterium]
MKKPLILKMFNSIPIFKGLRFLLLLFFTILFLNVNAQNIISRLPADYLPDGIVPTSPAPCADYTVLTDLDCIITLNPAFDGYNFQIPLVNEPDRPILTFIYMPSHGCNSGSIACSGDGTITMPTVCQPDNGENFIDFNIQVIHTNGTDDHQRYRIPILRNPVKIALVLDRSGSMDWQVPGGGAIRWPVLKNSVWEFTKMLELKQQGVEDSIGLTYFATAVIQPGIPIEDGFEMIPPNTAVELVSDTINYLMGLQTPEGWTAMGSGLKDAKSKLQGNTPIGATKIVLLFTDGEQNQTPMVQNDGRTLSDLSLLNDVPPNPEDSIRYYTIGMGGFGLVPPILSQIASANSGKFLYTTTGSTASLQAFFDDHFTDMLKSSSPQIVERQVGKLVNGKGTHTFTLNRVISDAIFKVSHNDGDNLVFTIEKGGDDFTPPEMIESSFVKMAKIKFPIINDDVTYASGEWTVNVTGDSNEEYYVTCIADDHFLDYSCKTDKNMYITGEYIDFIADLSYAGEALIGVNDSVKVIILKPGDDLGHLLATYTVPDDAIDYADDDLSPEEQKFLSLMNDPSFYEKLLPNEQVIKLQHQGNGIYKGQFNSTDLSGIYQAIIKFSGDITPNDIVMREKRLSIVVENGGFVSINPEQINDNTPPSVPANLISSAVSDAKVELNWNVSTDNTFVKYYKIYQDGSLIDSTSNLFYLVKNLNFSTDYTFYVIAKDIANNHSDPSSELAITTLDEPDTEAPDSPSNLVANDITQTNLNLSWNASDDNFGVVGYTLYISGDSVSSTENTSFLITDLSPGTNYSFSVTARDEAANESQPSSALNILTLDIPQPITAPTKLNAFDIKRTKLKLNWNTSSGGVGYVEYEIFKDGVLIGTTSNIAYSVTSLNESTSYSFHVIARDSENNISEASNTAEAITLDKLVDIENAYRILKIRPKNKFGYYLGPGFKQKISLKFKIKGPKPVTHTTSMLDESQEQRSVAEPYLKNIKDNLDGSYYLIVANVLPKTNPGIIINIGEEVYFDGPINGKLPIWLYILVILILLILIILRFIKSKRKFLMYLLWILLILLLIIFYLHKTGFLNFL